MFSIETLSPYCGEGIKYALFDFDGTISLIRQGWQEIMIPYFCEVLEALGTGEKDEELYAEVREFVDVLTGKQTIYQCMALCDAVKKRGGVPLEPGEYKAEYLNRLEKRIAQKKQGLADGSVLPETLTVKGAKQMLVALKNAGIKCYLASGTDEQAVIYEAGLLGVDTLFDGGIHGAKDALLDCSKEAVIRRLLDEENAKGAQLVCFGDGFVEIQLVAQLGGFAVGVATNEDTGDGINEDKRVRLINAGASVIIPHFEDTDAVMDLFTERKTVS